jgi:hypothetical protein
MHEWTVLGVERMTKNSRNRTARFGVRGTLLAAGLGAVLNFEIVPYSTILSATAERAGKTLNQH